MKRYLDYKVENVKPSCMPNITRKEEMIEICQWIIACSALVVE